MPCPAAQIICLIDCTNIINFENHRQFNFEPNWQPQPADMQHILSQHDFCCALSPQPWLKPMMLWLPSYRLLLCWQNTVSNQRLVLLLLFSTIDAELILRLVWKQSSYYWWWFDSKAGKHIVDEKMSSEWAIGFAIFTWDFKFELAPFGITTSSHMNAHVAYTCKLFQYAIILRRARQNSKKRGVIGKHHVLIALMKDVLPRTWENYVQENLTCTILN